MILSVSRRTDIPAFYSDWFYNRVKEGYALVRNPLNTKQISKVLINPEVVDCIVFWTKNPAPMLQRLDEIKDYNYYFHFAINPYNQNIELGIPPTIQIIETFKELSNRVGNKRTIWCYDPIFITKEIDINYHIAHFEAIAKHLHTYTKVCRIDFIQYCKKTVRNMQSSGMRALDDSEILQIAKSFVQIGKVYDMEIQAYTTKYDIESVGVKPKMRVYKTLIEEISGYKIKTIKDNHMCEKYNRVESIDIGEYHTCLHSCLYCYANDNDKRWDNVSRIERDSVQQKYKQHIKTSPVLVGKLTDEELANVKNRKCVSLRLKAELL